MRDLLWRVPLGALGGLIALYTFPTESIWVLTPLIPAFILLATLGVGFWKSFLIGFISGQVFYIAHIEWISLYLGPVPLLALSTLMALYFGLGTALTSSLYLRYKPKGTKVFLFAFVAAGVWTLREFVANNFPYGGFPWSKLAMTQSESIFSNWVWWGGLSLLSFVMALLGALIALLVKNFRDRKLPKRAFVATALATMLIPVITPIGLTTEQSGEKVIAAVQGNANAGLFSNVDKGTILQNHIDATELVFDSELAAEIDLLVWPENASDIDPLRSQSAREKIEAVAASVDAPFVFGTLTVRGEESFNSTLLWLPGVGPVDYYDKKQPVPFAEYAPDREFWRMFAPDLVDMIPKGYSFGVRDGIYEIDDFVAGTLICFEIAEDSILRELATSGAQVILSQTNNADFGYSDETYQQAGIAQLRAIETGRAVVNVSTVGVSAIFLPNGEVLSEVDWYEPAAMVERVPLYTGNTPAMTVGAIFDWLVAALIFIFTALMFARSRR
jgi:apolipoprotein N-acyltransferase